MPALLVLTVTKVKEHGRWRFSMTMPYIMMAAPKSPAEKKHLPNIKVLNKSGQKIWVVFPDDDSPCDPPAIPIDSNKSAPLPWLKKVPARSYYFEVSQSPPMGGNVQPANGTLDIVAGGGIRD